MSKAIGYVVVGEDLGKARGLISKWIQHDFGLESEACSVILHTDSEQAVRNLATGSSSRVTFQVREAQNQQHQSIGFAEKGHIDVSVSHWLFCGLTLINMILMCVLSMNTCRSH